MAARNVPRAEEASDHGVSGKPDKRARNSRPSPSPRAPCVGSRGTASRSTIILRDFIGYPPSNRFLPARWSAFCEPIQGGRAGVRCPRCPPRSGGAASQRWGSPPCQRRSACSAAVLILPQHGAAAPERGRAPRPALRHLRETRAARRPRGLPPIARRSLPPRPPPITPPPPLPSPPPPPS